VVLDEVAVGGAVLVALACGIACSTEDIIAPKSNGAPCGLGPEKQCPS